VKPQPDGFGELDAYLMREGKHPRLYEKLGSHRVAGGVRFAVWAPNATAVSVIGDWNDWKPGVAPLELIEGFESGGVWQGVIPGVERGAMYKYHLTSKVADYTVAKADPYAIRQEPPPGTASIVWDAPYEWRDAAWMASRIHKSARTAPISIYEVHLGSWRRVVEDGNRSLSYAEIAPELVGHVKRLGFTHVELMPLTEHPFYGSWGYETTGYFAATARYGYPEELKALVDALHDAGIAVILDWVPAHFPTDEHGLGYFDGTALYEHADRQLGFHPEWDTAIFDFGRQEVRSFLLSSALYWLEQFHVDGLRVDGVASMLYRDYARKAGEWTHREVPDAITLAEESTAWPHVTGRVDQGGLAFDYKWDMGWMHDTLKYLARDPIHRVHHHNELTMRGLYAFSERFVLPLSHDEVVHGKRSLLEKLPGDRWQQFATLRLLYAYMYSQPGKKLLFMGAEFAQLTEWNHDASLDWHLYEQEPHRQISLVLGALNHLYRTIPALHEQDHDPAGFRWVSVDDAERSVLAYERIARDGSSVIAALNFTPVPRHNYRLGVPTAGTWTEILNTDATAFGGSGQGNLGGVATTPVRAHGRELSINVTLPPLGAIFLRR